MLDTDIDTLSLHDALPIFQRDHRRGAVDHHQAEEGQTDAGGEQSLVEGQLTRHRSALLHEEDQAAEVLAARLEAGVLIEGDRKSTRLNSSHVESSYAVFCL